MIKKLAFAAGLWAAGTFLVLAAPAQAALIFFDNRTDFELASGLSGIDEDFEDANLAPGGAGGTSNPLDATTDDNLFSPGDIASGLSFSVSNPFSSVVVYGDGLFGPSNKVRASLFSDLNIITLNPTATAIGFDLFAMSASTTLDIELFDAFGGALGSTSVTGVNGATPTFFGVLSDMGAIGQLTIGNPDVAEFIDNITFGNAVTQLPEPGTLALFGLGLLGLGVAVRRRRQKRLHAALTVIPAKGVSPRVRARAASCRRQPQARTVPTAGSSGLAASRLAQG